MSNYFFGMTRAFLRWLTQLPACLVFVAIHAVFSMWRVLQWPELPAMLKKNDDLILQSGRAHTRMNKRLFAKTGLSLERLRTFAEIVAASGISNAAPGDSNRQSQFSRQLKELEEFFGAELLRRGRGQFALTTAGRELFQIVQANFNAMEDLAERCAKENVEVALGSGESVLHWMVLPCLSNFRSKQSTITFVLQNLQTEEVINRLLDGRVDVGLIRQDSVRSPLKSTRLGSIEYRLVMPSGSAATVGKKNGWDFIKKQPVALLAGSEVAAAFESEAEKHGVRLNVCLRGSSYAQLIEAVTRLKCGALLPNYATTPSLSSEVITVPVKSLKSFSRSIAIVWNPRFCALRPSVVSAIETITPMLRRILEEARNAGQ